MFTTATSHQCQKLPVVFGDRRTSLSLFMLCCSCFSQFPANTCQIKTAYINKGWEELIFTVLSQGQHQFAGPHKVQTHYPQFSMLLPWCCSLSESPKTNHMGLWFTSKAQTFLLFSLFKKSTLTNLPLHHCPKLLLLLQSVAPKNNKIPSVFSWASPPARQKDFRT